MMEGGRRSKRVSSNVRVCLCRHGPDHGLPSCGYAHSFEGLEPPGAANRYKDAFWSENVSLYYGQERSEVQRDLYFMYLRELGLDVPVWLQEFLDYDRVYTEGVSDRRTVRDLQMELRLTHPWVVSISEVFRPDPSYRPVYLGEEVDDRRLRRGPSQSSSGVSLPACDREEEPPEEVPRRATFGGSRSSRPCDEDAPSRPARKRLRREQPLPGKPRGSIQPLPGKPRGSIERRFPCAHACLMELLTGPVRVDRIDDRCSQSIKTAAFRIRNAYGGDTPFDVLVEVADLIASSIGNLSSPCLRPATASFEGIMADRRVPIVCYEEPRVSGTVPFFHGTSIAGLWYYA